MNTLRYFKLAEFDSPDDPGSGGNMNRDFLDMLDRARSYSGCPYRITSGYRTPEHNMAVGGKEDSSHLEGLAADIATRNSRERMQVLHGCVKAGFNRIGIGSTFIHVDDDPSKAEEVCWLY